MKSRVNYHTIKQVIILAVSYCFCTSCFCQKKIPGKEERTGITFSFPYLNNYHFYHYEKAKDSSLSGFCGIGLGYFSMLGENRMSVNAGLTADMIVPIGPIDIQYEGEYVWMRSKFIEFLYHHNLFSGLYAVGGINFTIFTYRFANFDTDIDYRKNDKSVGVTTGIEYVLGRNFSVAAIYKPALIPFDHKSYKHLLTLDFRFNINIRKKALNPGK